MSATVKNAVIKTMVEGQIVEIMVKSNVENIYLPDGTTTLASKLAEILASINGIDGDVDSKISAAIDALIDGAPETYNTLKEIADYLATHQNEYTALLATVGGKVDKEEGKGLSTEDFTSELKAKLEGIAEEANKYELPKATTSSLGGVKIGSGVTVADDGTISVADKPTIYVQADQPSNLKANDLWIQTLA